MRVSRYLSASVTLLAIAGAGCGVFNRSDANDDHSPVIAPVAVKVDAVRAEDWPDNWEESGFLRKGKAMTLVAKMTGAVRNVAVSKGQPVKEKTLLVAFDTSGIEATMKEAGGAKPATPQEVQQASEALEAARLKLGSAKTDAEKKAAQTTFDRALTVHAELRTRSAELATSQQAVASMREASFLLAPVTGRVGEIFAVRGQLLAEGEPVLGFEPTDLYVEILVDALKLGAAAVDSTVIVDIGGNCSGKAKILEILEAPPDSKTGEAKKEVRTSLPPCKAPKLDARGRVRFDGPTHKVVTVAESAVVRPEGKTSVFLVEDGFARLQRVTVGEGKSDRLEAIAGLAPGSKVVVHPPAGLKDSVMVRVEK